MNEMEKLWLFNKALDAIAQLIKGEPLSYSEEDMRDIQRLLRIEVESRMRHFPTWRPKKGENNDE